MDDVQAIAVELVFAHHGLCTADLLVADDLADSYQVERLRLLVGRLRDDLRAWERALVLDKLADVVLRDTLPDDAHCHVSGRQHREHHHAQDISVDDFQSLCIDELLSPEVHHAHAEIGGQRDEHRVDEKQIESAEEERSLAHGQPVACRAERRHEGCGDGYAGDDIALALC